MGNIFSANKSPTMWKEAIAHTILVGVAGLITVSSKPGSTLFSWHPFCMVIAMLLWTEGTLAFRVPKHSQRVNVHWALNGVGTILALFGFLAAYRHLEIKGEKHFASYHSCVGSGTLLLLLAQTFGGNLVVYRKYVSVIPAGLLKWGHRISGVLTITGVYATAFLTLYKVPPVCIALFYPYAYTMNRFFNVHSSKLGSKAKKSK